MGKRSAVLFLLCAFLCLTGTASAVDTWYVATDGNDDRAGDRGKSVNDPFETIQYAVDQASSGDTINVAAGRYNKADGDPMVAEILGIDNLTIQGDPDGGTIIDGSDDTINGGWGTPNAYGRYQISRPYNEYGQFLVISVDLGDGPEYVISGDADSYDGAIFFGQPGYLYSLYYWGDHLNRGFWQQYEYTYFYGIPSSSKISHTDYCEQSADEYRTLRGLAFHSASGQYPDRDDGNLYLKLVVDYDEYGNEVRFNVNDATVKCSREKTLGGVDCGGFLVGDDADGITLRNLHFENGFRQLKVLQADDAVIEHCSFRAGKKGICLGDRNIANSGPENTTIRYCDFDVHPFALRSGYQHKYAEYANILWSFQKEFGAMDMYAILMWNSFGGHTIHDNFIQNGWDGIGGKEDNDWKGTIADHNLIINMMDDPFEITGNGSNTQIHHNVSINSSKLTRIRDDISTEEGPLFFYNNMLISGPMTTSAFNLSDTLSDGLGELYFYNNTIEGGFNDKCEHGEAESGAIFCNQSADVMYENWWWANNLFHGYQWMKANPDGIFGQDDQGKWHMYHQIQWNADFNVYSLNDNFSAWNGVQGRYDTEFDRNIDTNNDTHWVLEGPGYVHHDASTAPTRAYWENYNLALTAGSPAIGEGSDNLAALFGETLPNTPSDDCGAVPYGTPMFVVPRTEEPSIGYLSPSAGPTAGGTSVTLVGSGLGAASAVKFGSTSVSAYPIANQPDMVRCTAPAKSAATYDVCAVVDSADTNAVDYTYVAAPTLSSISPASGPTAGMTPCTLTGTNLSTCTAVTFAGAPATNVSVVSNTEIRCKSPAGTAGARTVTVTTVGGSANTTYTYTSGGVYTETLPVVVDTYVNSASAGTSYGTYDLRTHKSSQTERHSYLKFDVSEVTGSIIMSATLRICKKSGNETAHDVDIYSMSDDSWSGTPTWTSRPSSSTWSASPIATNASAHSNGVYYDWDVTDFVQSEVDLSEQYASFVLRNPVNYDEWWYSSESANAPELVVVSQGGGGGGGTPAPTLSGIWPNSGTTVGGTAVTLTGTNFISGASVSFDGSAATGVVVDSATQIRCTSPAHGAGTIGVTVTTSNGTSGSVNYTYQTPQPSLISITPDTGGTAGGTACTLAGDNLIGCSAVSFGGTAATGIVVDSASQVRCTSPAKDEGTYGVTATTSVGTSNAVSFTYDDGGGQSHTNTLSVAEDSWVDSSDPNDTGGGDKYVTVNSWDGNKYRYMILKFNLSGIEGSTVTSAKLQVYKWGATATVNLDVMGIADDSWSEGTVKWNGMPTKGSSKAQIATGTTAGYKEWDITSYISAEKSGDGVASMYITDESMQGVYTQWTTKEKAGYVPRLVVISQ